jgi:hypothetical protein
VHRGGSRRERGEVGHLRSTISGASRWLESDLPWVIDHRDGKRWVEFGRHASRREAEAMVARLVSRGRGESSSFRVAYRPARLLVVALVACLIVGAVLVVFVR